MSPGNNLHPATKLLRQLHCGPSRRHPMQLRGQTSPPRARTCSPPILIRGVRDQLDHVITHHCISHDLGDQILQYLL